MSSLKELVDAWLAMDQNDATRAEIQTLWDKGDTDTLERRMRNRIEFGTAGLRGRMEAGWSRMNDLIVIQASQGLCHYVLEQVKNASNKGVVVGHDHRHNSERWAQLTAAAFLNNGVKVYFHRGLVHTPMVPFTVKKVGAACGVMITASHNPKYDNGYKVYWENSVQIISPHDEGISNAIKAHLEPKTWNADLVNTSSLCLDITEEMKEAYLTSLLSLKDKSLPSTKKSIFVNTSMHGVGHPFVQKALSALELSIKPVQEQQKPDPDFPTVSYPNPEEKGALDLAIATANKAGADYVLAQDPDADRFSAVEKQPNGEWLTFTGDQLGVVFAAYVMETYKKTGKPMSKLAMVASTVSSKMVEAMAQAENFKFAECLTGFKYIGNTAMNLVAQGYEVPFGYEEAIGFMFGSEIRDKDGVAASVMFAQLAEILRNEGRTVKSYLDDLYKRYGYFKTSNSYFICNEPATIDKIFVQIRNFEDSSTQGFNYPKQIGGLTVTSVIDLTTGYDSTNPPTYKPSLPLSSGHMIQFRAENREQGTKIILTTRTSGTEPKVKYYLEGSGSDSEQVTKTLVEVVKELGDVWMEAKKNNLGVP
ncbi:phosphoglucomutase 1 [Dendrothele bispora CBS 962.96]|uniref:Phosphoglucomutase 1 n=1 Tax=Dendrothele bispora (strain CBS 962.96) TaxID=1314807 RepID=A0A4S8M9R3_DENBC|nr:phosphoglucomutase 1 [Dendrothele bispora CBS 962.96]